MKGRLDVLGLASEKAIVREFKQGGVLPTQFNDYKKKQERSLLVSTRGVYNIKAKEVRRFIDIVRIKALVVSKIGTEFVLVVPEEYDYRYASAEHRNDILFCILKVYHATTQDRLPLYEKDELNLMHYATTKEDARKEGRKELRGDFVLHTEETFARQINGEEKEKEEVRRATKTFFPRTCPEARGPMQVTLADFTPRLVLGRGAFGTVMLVEKKDTRQLYAMKSLEKDELVRKNQVEHTRTEKMILEHVNHPFLVNLEFAFQTPRRLYFIMQFMKGGELFQHLSVAKRFPEAQARFYTMQLALGLAHLHRHGFIYRDIKLENVLMDEEGNVCLTDFGMSKLLREGETARTFCGTPEYLAPEVLGGPGYNKDADWWSLGILAFEMMNGLPPFYDANQAAMFRLIKESAVKFNERLGLSDDCKDFLARILQKSPGQRLGSAGDGEEVLSHPWFRGLSREKMLKKEVGAETQLPTPFRPKTEGERWLEGFDAEFTRERVSYEEREEGRESKESEHFKKIFEEFTKN